MVHCWIAEGTEVYSFSLWACLPEASEAGPGIDSKGANSSGHHTRPGRSAGFDGSYECGGVAILPLCSMHRVRAHRHAWEPARQRAVEVACRPQREVFAQRHYIPITDQGIADLRGTTMHSAAVDTKLE